MAQFSIPIEDIVDLLGLERSPINHPGARSIKVHCPFCGHKGYTMDVDVVNCVYHCFHCPDDLQKHNGALDLYSRVRMGYPSYLLNRKDVFHQLCMELGNGNQQLNIAKESSAQDRNIYPADDAALNEAYSSLLRLPYLQLSKKHVDNLMARGLPESVAFQGKYASIPPSYTILKNHPKGEEISEWYWSRDVETIRKKSPVLSSYRWKDVAAGVLIADDLISQDVNLKRVPGFYRITPEKWAFRYDTGMLVPTISYEGNIVGIQTRKDSPKKNGLRYMTLSSKGLPEGVTAKIARVHVIHSEAAISENTQVYITEGPLKADVILWYLTGYGYDDIAIIALQGVKNTKEIPEIAVKLCDAGVHTVYSALDMDKCGNVAVADADRALRKLFRCANIRVNTIAWDSDFAKKKKYELATLAEINQIPFTPSGNDFADIGSLAQIFTERHIEYNVQYVNGKKTRNHWRTETKGYDDYLHSLVTGTSKAERLININTKEKMALS